MKNKFADPRLNGRRRRRIEEGIFPPESISERHRQTESGAEPARRSYEAQVSSQWMNTPFC